MSLSPANKNLFRISFIFIHLRIKHPTMEITGVLIPKLVRNHFTYFFTNSDFLSQQSAHFNWTISLSFFILKSLLCLSFKSFFYTLLNKSPFSFRKYISKEKQVLLTALNHTHTVLWVKHSAHFDFALAFLCDIESDLISKRVNCVCFTVFTTNMHDL